MRSTTDVYIAMRSVGVANDKGTVIHGTLKTVILELAKFAGNHDLKRRFQFSIARTQEEAMAGVRIKGDPNESESELLADLAALMGDEGDESDQTVLPGIASEAPVPPHATTDRLPGDDWKGA